MRWHPKGHLVLAGSEDSSVWMWNADSASYMNVFNGHGSSVTCGDFTPDGTYFLYGENLTIFLLSIILSFCRIYCYWFSLSKGKTICTGSNDATMRIWNPRTAEVIHVVRGMSFSFSFPLSFLIFLLFFLHPSSL